MAERGRRPAGRGPYAVVVDTVVDQDGVERLRSDLERACIEHSGDLYVDCRALNYACLDALRALVAAAQAVADDDRRLVLVGLSPYFVEVFRVTGWDDTPGLVFSGTEVRSPHRTPAVPRPDPPDPPDAAPSRRPSASVEHDDVERSRHAISRPRQPEQP
jgi:anti-anti-sigma regulatory factor